MTSTSNSCSSMPSPSNPPTRIPSAYNPRTPIPSTSDPLNPIPSISNPSTPVSSPVSCTSEFSSSETAQKNSLDMYSFLTDRQTGFLRKVGLHKSDLSFEQESMYKIHRTVSSRLSKLKNLLNNERIQFRTLKELYKVGKFQFIEDNLNKVTTQFINSQLRNANKPPTARRWSTEDKAFALSLFKRSPKLYNYLRNIFQLPSPRSLQLILASIPFECGLLKPVLEHLKIHVENMDEIDRYCALIFDEMSLSSGLYYESHKQRISGFEDLGTKGRTSNPANHALIFMIRSISKCYKMPVAYFFTKDSIKTDNLKEMIIQVIRELRLVGMKVCATVCDQGSSNRAAIAALTREYPDKNPSPYQFIVDGELVVTIFDVPHLLKNTRNAIIDCRIEFEKGKFASMEHILQAFQFDNSRRTYRCLFRMKESYFNFKDSYMKMKVKVAARQLSQTMAAAIETFHSSGHLKSDSLHTAEFCHLMDNLFDSLNSSQVRNHEGRKFRSALSGNSPHLEFWSDMLSKINRWKIFDKQGKLRNNFKFVDGWLTSIRAIILLWKKLQLQGITFLNLRNLNQDPLENFFGQIRQHGVCNTNPTCQQFVAAMKTLIINNLSSPLSKSRNGEDDFCEFLGNFGKFIEKYSGTIDQTPETSCSNTIVDTPDSTDEIFLEQNYATAYVAGYILSKVDVLDCVQCRNNLFSNDVILNQHLFVTFKENDERTRLNYPSERLVQFIDLIHEKCYKYLHANAHNVNLVDNFRNSFKKELVNFSFCGEHNITEKILTVNYL